VASKELLTTLSGSTERFMGSLSFSPDGRFLAANAITEIIVWETASWREVKKIQLGTQWQSGAFSPDGQTYANCVKGGVGFWDTEQSFRGSILHSEQSGCEMASGTSEQKKVSCQGA